MTHPDTDALAEFRAGLVAGRRGARIAAHLAGCERCAALDDQLAGVRSLLASVPATPLPDSVAQRLDTVLAAEVARRDDPERARADSAGESAPPPRVARHRGPRLLPMRLLAPAAAVVVLGAGLYGLTRIGSSSSSSSAATSAQGAAQPASSAVASAASNARSAAGPAFAPAVSPAKGAVPRPRQMTAANFVVVTSNMDFTRAGFRQQVEAELQASRPLARQEPLTPVRACVQKLAGRDTLLLVERARYEGQSATLVVARTSTGEEAWIAGAGCSRTSRDVLDEASLPAGTSEP